MTVVLCGHGDHVGAEHLGDDRIDRETVFGNDDVLPGAHQRVPDEFDDLVRPVAENQRVAVDGQFPRQLLAEVEAGTVRIEMNVLHGAGHRIERMRRRTQRVFVRRQFDDVRKGQSELAGDVFDRPSRLVDRQIFESFQQ